MAQRTERLNYPILIVALIPGLWLLGRFVRWRSYVVALTSTRILVRQGILGRDTVQLRLQRITEVNIRQTPAREGPRDGLAAHRRAGRGRHAHPGVHAQAGRRARVLNSQINEIVGGGRREAIPAAMQPRDRYGAPYADRDTDEHRGDDDGRDGDAHDTPPFGVGGSTPPRTPPRSVADPAPAAHGRARAPPASRYGTGSSSSTTCASAASSPRRSSPPRRASSSTAFRRSPGRDRRGRSSTRTTVVHGERPSIPL